MAKLPSGLPDHVGDEEAIARFLTSSNQFNSITVKPSAFLPSPKYRETSVFRHGRKPIHELWKIGKSVVSKGDRSLHGAAILKASDIRNTDLDVHADEPPPKHAVIRKWPWLDNDPDTTKAQQKLLAIQLATAAGPPVLIS